MKWPFARRLAAAALLVTASAACASASAGTYAIPDQVEGIPDVVLRAYGQAAAAAAEIAPDCTGMRWSVVAGIGQEESHHGTLNGASADTAGDITPPIIGVALDGGVINDRGDTVQAISDTDGGRYDRDPKWDRAVGPMQFIPATWETWGKDGNGDGVADPHNIVDAAYAAVAYLCGTGKTNLNDPAQLRDALYRYNHSSAYVENVYNHIQEYDAIPVATAGGYGAGASGAAATAIAWATQHVGSPYVWGGQCMDPLKTIEGPRGSPTAKDRYHNCDCSSLVQQAYAAAGVSLTRTTTTQFAQDDLLAIEPVNGRGSALTDQDLAALQPGDLIYFASEGAPGAPPTHVGMYLGNRQMIHAPNSRRDIEIIDLKADRGGYYMGGGGPLLGHQARGRVIVDETILSPALDPRDDTR
ncbi:C40 family peptidase [Thermobifida halotolerans]|uniref:C40 family peptidase n=1 Tax=Thermobifida halotolerans TaxID=483545 RepID=UPI0035135DD4